MALVFAKSIEFVNVNFVVPVHNRTNQCLDAIKERCVSLRESSLHASDET